MATLWLIILLKQAYCKHAKCLACRKDAWLGYSTQLVGSEVKDQFVLLNQLPPVQVALTMSPSSCFYCPLGE